MSRVLIIGTILLLPLIILGGMWGFFLLSGASLENSIATLLPWPVACSTRGCVTSTTWKNYHHVRTTFALATQQEPPAAAETLTTLLRQHLARYAFLRSPATAADARRYREEILNATSEEQLQAATGLSATEYDKRVVQPFLQQEALRQSRRTETPEELYQQLAQERWIFVLPRTLWWNKELAKVETK